MGPPPTIYPLEAVQTLAVHTQGLDAVPTAAPGIDDIYNIIEQLGCVQIDTLQMVQRSQYLTLWSRLGSYDTSELDRLIYDDGDRRLFEYWLHAACIIPLKSYRYRLQKMRWLGNGNENWNKKWLAQAENQKTIEHVLKEVRRRGPLRAADFETDSPRRGEWWDWKPAKRALEFLYDRGDLMIRQRINFQRVYDLRERVLPDWVESSMPTDEETHRYWLERSVRALGICKATQAADYTHTKRTVAKRYVEELLDEGVFVPIQATLSDDAAHELIVHRDNLPLLEQAADDALQPARTTFLSPFDNLFWAKGRDMAFWNFRQVLEAYKPAKDRIWGYFCLPILHKGQLVGRFDPKLERKSGQLRLQAFYLEPGVKPDEELVGAIAATMRDFMAFHNASDLAIEQSKPATFGRKLLAAVEA